jgi:hypothetical protein
MSSDRVLSLRNRVVFVPRSLSQACDIPPDTMDSVPEMSVNVPAQDPDDLQSRLEAMERMLQDLFIRIPAPVQISGPLCTVTAGI